ARVEAACLFRLGADGGGVEKQVRAPERHRPGRFGEPLVPADAYPDGAEARAPRLEPGVARVEVVLLLVAGSVRDVALAVDAEDVAGGVYHGQAVEVRLAGPFEERQRQHHPELSGEAREAVEERVVVDRVRQRERLFAFELWEVQALE